MPNDYGRKFTEAEKDELARGFASVINSNCVENFSNTPDYILGEYLVNCLEAYHQINARRETWYGRKLEINSEYNLPLVPVTSSEPVNLEEPSGGPIIPEAK